MNDIEYLEKLLTAQTERLEQKFDSAIREFKTEFQSHISQNDIDIAMFKTTINNLQYQDKILETRIDNIEQKTIWERFLDSVINWSGPFVMGFVLWLLASGAGVQFLTFVVNGGKVGH